MRKPLALPATYETIAPGQDAYLRSTQLRTLVKSNKRYWAFYSVPTTVALPGNCYAKSLTGFPDHNDESSFHGLLAEYAEHNCPRPSGYSDVFHECYRSPRVPWSINAPFAPCLSGGWQCALLPGVHQGTYFKYDINSAYLWSASLGLPDTKTYTRSLSPLKDKFEGLYRVKLLRPEPSAPSPFNAAYECIATTTEIESYNLKIAEIIDGVTWKRTVSGEPIVNAVMKVSTWKQAARSYWGRWGQAQKVSCYANRKTWQLPNIVLNIPWAHVIISRIKMRLWEYSSKAVHVYVDSVITKDQLPTGDRIGDWRLQRSYDGIFIRGPGQYGALKERTLEKMAGTPRDSARRSTLAAVLL